MKVRRYRGQAPVTPAVVTDGAAFRWELQCPACRAFFFSGPFDRLCGYATREEAYGSLRLVWARSFMVDGHHWPARSCPPLPRRDPVGGGRAVYHRRPSPRKRRRMRDAWARSRGGPVLPGSGAKAP